MTDIYKQLSQLVDELAGRWIAWRPGTISAPTCDLCGSYVSDTSTHVERHLLEPDMAEFVGPEVVKLIRSLLDIETYGIVIETKLGRY